MPKLPRGRGLKLDGPMMFRIGGTLILLVMIILMRRPCADATSKFVTGFGEEGSAVVPKPGTIDLPAGGGSAKPTGDGLEHVGPGATDEEVRAAWERTKAKAKAAEGSAGSAGSGSAGSAGSGSGAAGSSSARSGSAGSGSAN